jgi:hypothetical protein
VATELPLYEIRMIHGESFDVTIEAPVSYQPYEDGAEGDNPLEDGSNFFVSFKAETALEEPQAVIRFATTNSTPPFLSKGAYVSTLAKIVLAFQAPDARMRQIPVGVYLGDLMHWRPRLGPLGDQAERIARIKLTIEPGTE